MEYIRDFEESKIRVERYNEGMREEGRIEGIAQGIEQEKERHKIIIEQSEAAKHQAEVEKQNIELIMTITRLYYKDGKSISEIADITKKSAEYVKKALE
ncbi:MAG: hypothetical protein U9R19_12665 [Bacteroidota bacterium]|nr:hypothetical protein [Bacteroidota bacterium]